MPLNKTCDPIKRSMIVEPVDLSSGQWFKCGKGHLYCSSDGLGVADVSKCPQCWEKKSMLVTFDEGEFEINDDVIRQFQDWRV